jgi:4-aminobutyrate aminotransferase-like enzyme
MPESPTGGGWSVFLVNSGSEANDLAFQIARDATGRQGIVVLEVGGGCRPGGVLD